jgi:hypothetical protein
VDTALPQLAALIEGAVNDNRLVGRYRGFDLEARLMRENPAPTMPVAQGSTRRPGTTVDVFSVKQIGVAGRHPWDCRNEPTLLGNDAPERGRDEREDQPRRQDERIAHINEQACTDDVKDDPPASEPTERRQT